MRLRLRPATAVAAAATFAVTGVGATIASQSATADEGTSSITSLLDISRARRPYVSRHINRSAIHMETSETPVTPTPDTTTTPASDDHIVPFAPDSAWFLRADTATRLADDSGAQVGNLVNQVRANTGGVAHINWSRFATGILNAPAGTAPVRIGFNDCQHTGFTGDMYTGRRIFENVPMPAAAAAAAGDDGHLSLYDPASDSLWDFWQLRREGAGWSACWGGRIDKVHENRGYFTATEGASASGMAIAGGAITVADVKRGYINHALNIGIPQTAGWRTWTWPAQRADGTPLTGQGLIRHGQRLRLDPSVDVDALGLSRVGTMIAKAAQEYGFIVTDQSGTVSFSVESADQEEAATGRNPWPVLLGGDEWTILDGFPWSKMQALPLDYGK